MSYRNRQFVRSRRLIDIILKTKNDDEEIMQNTERPGRCEGYDEHFSLLNPKDRKNESASNFSTTKSIFPSCSGNNDDKVQLTNTIATCESSSQNHENNAVDFCCQQNVDLTSTVFSNIASTQVDDMSNIYEIIPTIQDLVPVDTSLNACRSPNLVYTTLTMIEPLTSDCYDNCALVDGMHVNEVTNSPESPSILNSDSNVIVTEPNSGNLSTTSSVYVEKNIVQPTYGENLSLKESMSLDESTTLASNVCQNAVVSEPPGNADSVCVINRSASSDENVTNDRPIKRIRIRDKTKRLEYDMKNHKMLPACGINCRQKCTDKFTEAKRKSLWDVFWSMELQRRRDFIARNVSKKNTNWKSTPNSKRSHTLSYTFNSLKVCKTFFLSTLGYKHDRIIRSVLKNSSLSNVCAVPDQRGRHEPSNKFESEFNNNISSFIEKYKPMKSHYTVKNAPNRRYLPIGCSFTSIFKDLNKFQGDSGEPTCSWGHFHKIISKMNISCAMPAQDKCLKCSLHENNHHQSEDHDCTLCKCSACDGYMLHIKNKNISRKHLHEDTEAVAANSKKEVFSVDMQKVLLMPKIDYKEYFFLRKLVLFNETFASPGKNQPAYCLLWHEGESGRKAYNIASAFIIFLKTFARDLEEIYIYCDNCSAQNKNKVLFSSLIRYINSYDCGTNIIKIEYLEPGHTYMPADCVHGAITRKLTKTPNIYDIQDFIKVISEARKDCHVKYFEHQQVYIFENEAKTVFPKGYNTNNLKIIEFRRGKTCLFAKNDYDQKDFKELNIFNTKLVKELKTTISNGYIVDTLENIPKQVEPRGITKEKKDDLLKMVQSIPANRKSFYDNLKVNDDVVDLGVSEDS